ncbi:MAG TPA: hypothetical protein VGB78_03625 [Thermoplasmata archaeon]
MIDPTDVLPFLFGNGETSSATYLFLLFWDSFLTAVILPFPVEPFLLLHMELPAWSKAVVLGLGKAAGAAAVFYIGASIEKVIYSWRKFGWFRWLLDKMEKSVKLGGIYAIFLLNSVPIMSDTLINYLFALLNKEGKLIDVRLFVISNFLAGINRALLVLSFGEATGLF